MMNRKYQIRPTDPIPEEFLPVLASWQCIRDDKRWRLNYTLAEYLRRPRLLGWTRTGEAIYGK